MLVTSENTHGKKDQKKDKSIKKESERRRPQVSDVNSIKTRWMEG